MNSASATIRIFGWYIVSSGMSLLLIPNFILQMFNHPQTNDIWIRMGGLLLLILGLYYLSAANNKIISFFRMTVWGRFIFGIGIIFLSLIYTEYWVLSVFGIIDILGGIWTHFALKSKEK